MMCDCVLDKSWDFIEIYFHCRFTGLTDDIHRCREAVIWLCSKYKKNRNRNFMCFSLVFFLLLRVLLVPPVGFYASNPSIGSLIKAAERFVSRILHPFPIQLVSISMIRLAIPYTRRNINRTINHHSITHCWCGYCWYIHSSVRIAFFPLECRNDHFSSCTRLIVIQLRKK